MKKQILLASFLGLIGTTALSCWAPPARANNSYVEAQLQSYGDLSMFYQALLNTGAINQLDEGENYTIFAPTNAAFAEIQRQNYPCFYEVQCRPQIAALLLNHIIPGRRDLAELTDRSVPTLGGDRIHVVADGGNNYTVDGHSILSKSDSDGNILYRIDGVIATPQELAQFQVNPGYMPTTYAPASMNGNGVMHYRTVPPATYYPGGAMVAPTTPLDNNSLTTTTVTHTYTVPQ